MKLAYACNYIYSSDAANLSIYSNVYLKYVADFAEGSYPSHGGCNYESKWLCSFHFC